MSWRWGETDAIDAVERALAEGRAQVLHESDRRRISRVDAPQGPLLVKQFRVASGLHPWRDGARALARRGPGEIEARTLRRLAGVGAPLPRPLAWGTSANGDALLVMEHLPGRPLVQALAGTPAERRALLRALGDAISWLHGRGTVHGDLHHGNVMVGPCGPVLLDLQQARRRSDAAARARDVATLDHSLAPFLSTAGRVRLRAAALGLVRPFDPPARAALRAVGVAARERERSHFESRRRHALRPGRAFAAVRIGDARGLRLRDLPEATVAAALAAHEAALSARDARVLERDPRGALCAVQVDRHRMVSKEAHRRGALRALADVFRGSPARRAWAGGHGLQILALGAATPLAYLEWRRAGVPVRSLVLLEDLRPDEGAHRVLERAAPEARAAALDAMLRLLLRLHRARVDHGDLKASNVLLRPVGRGFEPRLVDLEGVRFRRVLPDGRRVRALAQLNASVGDALPTTLRARFFARYAQALRFAAGAAAARQAVVRESLARQHRWTGRDCAGVDASSGPRPDRAGPRSTGT